MLLLYLVVRFSLRHRRLAGSRSNSTDDRRVIGPNSVKSASKVKELSVEDPSSRMKVHTTRTQMSSSSSVYGLKLRETQNNPWSFRLRR
ncbi:hypothetical protein AVEN_18122-1 [Araneus ventricosus]|uniref:Uncharacterized protein n=1 Tax=Araneus ventricosus TaxID=182803 RepID=A0A4Y2AJX2_ARAVE|nr:hypothetical protein AVEN_18122-1 [Araneus ventricosus]